MYAVFLWIFGIFFYLFTAQLLIYAIYWIMKNKCFMKKSLKWRLNFQIYAKFVDFICQFIEKYNLLQLCTRVRLSVCVCVCVRMR